MTELRDVTADMRFEQGFIDDAGTLRTVFADYGVLSDARVILHVEADPALRGSGAAGRFMQSLADHARRENIKRAPRCSYAVAWFKRNPDQSDVLVA